MSDLNVPDRCSIDYFAVLHIKSDMMANLTATAFANLYLVPNIEYNLMHTYISVIY